MKTWGGVRAPKDANSERRLFVSQKRQFICEKRQLISEKRLLITRLSRVVADKLSEVRARQAHARPRAPARAHSCGRGARGVRALARGCTRPSVRSEVRSGVPHKRASCKSH